MKLTEALLHALKERGAREMFGIPGDFALPYFKVVEESGILPLHTLSHEPAVGFAADAAARFRGGLGVAGVTYGAGALNMVNAVAQAYAEKSPLVVISGTPGAAESRRGLLLHHQAKTLDSQFRIFQEVTCDQAVLDDAAQAPARMAAVLQSCLEHSQPVYIEIPRDMAVAECGPVPPPASFAVDDDAVGACAEEILKRLETAAAPVLMVGVEVRRFGLEAKVERLARALGVPVVTSFMGRGLLASYEDLAGVYLGVAGDPTITAAVEGSDCLLLMGVILSDTNFGVSERAIDMRRTIQMLDRQVRLGFHVYQDLPLSRLIDALMKRLPSDGRGRPRPALRGRRAVPLALEMDDAPIGPMDIAAAVNQHLQEHGADGQLPLACDMGDCLFTAMSLLPTPLVAPGYYASMGFGVPAGLGVQLTSGQRTLILVGDGAFQMTGWELCNCVRLGLDPVVIVFNNSMWQMLSAFQPGMGYHQLAAMNYADVAAALGGVGRRAATRRELGQAIKSAFAERGRFQLIEAVLPQGSLSETLDRFVTTFRRRTGAL